MKKDSKGINSSHGRFAQKSLHRICTLLTAVFITVAVLSTFMIIGVSGQETEEQQSGDSGLSIVVVEDISVHDQIVIEDEGIPLAEYSEGESDAGVRHAVMMGVVLFAVIAYAIYFDRRDKKLFELRQEAARARKRMM